MCKKGHPHDPDELSRPTERRNAGYTKSYVRVDHELGLCLPFRSSFLRPVCCSMDWFFVEKAIVPIAFVWAIVWTRRSWHKCCLLQGKTSAILVRSSAGCIPTTLHVLWTATAMIWTSRSSATRKALQVTPAAKTHMNQTIHTDKTCTQAGEFIKLTVATMSSLATEVWRYFISYSSEQTACR